ncbi:hypothetical protein J4204_03595 [Candidatus Woesearchaeota archaeon]|nr:hypothetical protein [Candidatus Woesearchaeota archaeon]
MKIGTIGKEEINLSFWQIFGIAFAIWLIFGTIKFIINFTREAVALAGG